MKWLCSFFLFFTVFINGYALTDTDIEQLQSYLPRPEGTQNEKNTLAFIAKFAKQLNINYTITPLNNIEQGHSFSSNIEFFIAGSSPDEIIYAMPLNNNNTSLIGLLILAEKLAEKPLFLGARFVFLGGEKGNTSQYPLGLNQFLQNYIPKGNYAIFYFDIEQISNKFQLQSYPSTVSSLATIQLALNHSRNSYFKNQFKASFQNIYSAKQSGSIVATNPFIAYFTNNKNTAKPLDLTEWSILFSNLLFNSHQKTLSLSSTVDLNYITLGSLFISEPLLVAIYMLIWFILLSLFSNNYSSIHRQQKYFVQNLWQYFLIFILFFIYFFISGLTLQSLLQVKQDPFFWQYLPLLFAVLMISLAFFLTIYSFRYIKAMGVLLSPKSYAMASLLFASLNLVLATLMHLTYAIPWLWFITFTLPFFYVKNLKYAQIFAFIAPLGLFVFLVNLFSADSFFIPLAIKNPLVSSLMVAVLLFPLLLLVLSLYNATHLKRQAQHQWVILTILFLITMACSTFILLYNPYGLDSTQKQPLTLVYTEDLDLKNRSIELSSPRPIKNINLNVDNQTFNLTNLGHRVPLVLSGDNPSTQMILTSQTVGLLSRNQIDITLNVINQEGLHPTAIDLQLIADRTIGVIDSNFPISQINPLQQTNTATIFVGANPPIPLKLRLITDREIHFNLKVTVHFDTSDIIADNHFNTITQHLVHQTFSL